MLSQQGDIPSQVFRGGGGMEIESYETITIPAHIQGTAYEARAPRTFWSYASDIDDFKTYWRIALAGAESFPASPPKITLYIMDVAKDEPAVIYNLAAQVEL